MSINNHKQTAHTKYKTLNGRKKYFPSITHCCSTATTGEKSFDTWRTRSLLFDLFGFIKDPAKSDCPKYFL